MNFPESTNFDIVQRTRLANRSRDSRGEEAGHRPGDLEISAWPQGTFPRRLWAAENSERPGGIASNLVNTSLCHGGPPLERVCTYSRLSKASLPIFHLASRRKNREKKEKWNPIISWTASRGSKRERERERGLELFVLFYCLEQKLIYCDILITFRRILYNLIVKVNFESLASEKLEQQFKIWKVRALNFKSLKSSTLKLFLRFQIMWNMIIGGQCRG